MSSAIFNPNLSITYGIDPRYRPMQVVVHNAPTSYQVAAAYHAGVNPQQIYHTQNPANLRPLQQNQNYINQAQIRAQAQNHVQNHIQKRAKLNHDGSSAQSPAQIHIPKRPQKHVQKRTQKLNDTQIRAKSSAQTQAQSTVQIHAQTPVFHTQRLAQIAPQNHAQSLVKPDAQNHTVETDPVCVPANIQAPTHWKTELKRLIDDVMLDEEVGFSPEFQMKVIAATTFCQALFAPSSSTN